jgi:hypothetical protein
MDSFWLVFAYSWNSAAVLRKRLSIRGAFPRALRAKQFLLAKNASAAERTWFPIGY